MLSMQRDTVRVQVADDGQLWMAEPQRRPCSVHDANAFLQELQERPGVRVRMLGTAANAKILHQLYQRLGDGSYLEVASPMICSSAEEWQNPQIAIYRMEQCLLPPSLGGWHRFTDVDDATYQLIAALQSGQSGASLLKLFQKHPLYRSLTFIEPLDQLAVVRILTQICDPRWFVNLRQPTRIGRVRMFMSLHDRYVEDVCSGICNTHRHFRCRCVLQAWGFLGKKQVSSDLPGNFLWRRLRDDATPGYRRVLRVSQTFLAYLIYSWQSVLSRSTTMELFEPTSILRADEVDAYRRHMQA